jgi:arylsulfatase A-like enzyme
MKLTRRQALAAAGTIGIARIAPSSALAERELVSETGRGSRKPRNIFCFVADDLGKEGLDFYPEAENVLFPSLALDTPNLTEFARGSRVFDNFIVTPLCLPTRVSFATGALPTRTRHLIFRDWTGVETCKQHRDTLYHHLRSIGLKTAAFGKWHLAFDLANCRSQPHAIGIDEYMLNLPASSGKSSSLLYQWGTELATGPETSFTLGDSVFAEDYQSDACCEFIRRNRNRPFYVQYWSALPHRPFLVTPENKARSGTLTDREMFVGMVEYADRVFGKIIETLRSESLLDDTLVLFFTDNGGDGPMMGGKGKVSEAGVSVPFMIRCPGLVEPGRETRLASIVDMVPTLTELLGSRSDSPDGVSIVDLMRDGASTPRRYAASIAYEDVWMVRDQKGKIAVDHKCRTRKRCNHIQYYDLLADANEVNPLEFENLSPVQMAHFHELLAEAKALGLPIYWEAPRRSWLDKLRGLLRQ